MADKQIYIATAPSRKSRQWRNEKTTWASLVERCSNSKDTGETLAQYKEMTRDDQSARKDVGGFVGGYLREGIRKKGHAEFRDVLTLDIDHAEPDFWEAYTMGFAYESFLYSTHTHTPQHRRYRLCILLSRSVSAEEYEAVGRSIAASIGIEQFDSSTYDPVRLMYWPSRPSDQAPVFEHQEGAALDPDAVLATYHNWRDASEWATSQREGAVIQREARKQGDPLEKPGIVGAFCRTYDIRAAIDQFLPSVYAPAGESRYTYNGGTVAQGLVLYEGGKFAYANNDTDPCSRRLVNAFDLVRMHLFLDLDENTDTSQSIDKRPSYLAMRDLALDDAAVKALITSERIASAADDFAHIQDPTSEDAEWMQRLDMDRKGGIKNTVNNAYLILLNAPAFKGKLAFSEFDGKLYVLDKLPWRAKGQWSKNDTDILWRFLEPYGVTTKDKVKAALIAVADEKKFHPVRSYLRSLKWDGQPRLATLFCDFLGAEDTELNRAMTVQQFKAAVARALNPGCKFDQCLILCGQQGVGKSTLLRLMGGEWYSESFSTFEGKEAIDNVRSSWIIEIGELSALYSAKSGETVKNFISRNKDDYRAAYAEFNETYLRQCVFFGTTNDNTFLSGDNGNRRFWVIPVMRAERKYSVFADLTDEYRNQLWAEAVALYRADPVLILPAELSMQAEQMQEAYNVYNEDDRVLTIAEFLDRRLPADWDSRSPERKRAWFLTYDALSTDAVMRRDVITIAELANEWAGMNIEKLTTYTSRQLGSLLRRVPGWRKADKPRRINGVVKKVYERINIEPLNNEEAL